MNVIQNGDIKRESEFFTMAELSCRHCGKLEIDWTFFDLITELRKFIDKPIKVSSFYRCPEHNQQIGGTKNSAHLYGKGIDISLVNTPLVSLVIAVEQFGVGKFNGMGYYPDSQDRIIHLDNLNRFARWVRLSGKYHSLL